LKFEFGYDWKSRHTVNIGILSIINSCRLTLIAPFLKRSRFCSGRRGRSNGGPSHFREILISFESTPTVGNAFCGGLGAPDVRPWSERF
jgi:hypothetical protein